MKALVTGSSGFLGQHLIKKLMDEGYSIELINRTTIKNEHSKNVKQYICDIQDEASLIRIFNESKADVVFHLAGYIGYKKSERQIMESVNVNGTKNVISAMEKSNTQKLIHMSSVVAVGAGFTPKDILNEESRYNLSHLNLGYFETKRKAEDIVIHATKTGAIQSVILNPSTIYGAGDATKGSRKTQVKVAKGKFPFYTNGGVSVVAVEDVVEALLKSVTLGKNGERYILSGENITIHQLFKIIAECAAVEPPNHLLPNFFLHTMGFLGDCLNSFGISGGLSRENAWSATMYHWFDNSKAKNNFGIDFKTASHAISKSVNWMRDNQIL